MCASLLVRWSAELQSLEFQDLVMFLQARYLVIAPAIEPRVPGPRHVPTGTLPSYRPCCRA
eukprot:scaffold17604_cov53-Phaeocystis_antarctica.AAC.1